MQAVSLSVCLSVRKKLHKASAEFLAAPAYESACDTYYFKWSKVLNRVSRLHGH